MDYVSKGNLHPLNNNIISKTLAPAFLWSDEELAVGFSPDGDIEILRPSLTTRYYPCVNISEALHILGSDASILDRFVHQSILRLCTVISHLDLIVDDIVHQAVLSHLLS